MAVPLYGYRTVRGRVIRDAQTWPAVLAVLSAPRGFGSPLIQRITGCCALTARHQARQIRLNRTRYLQGRPRPNAAPDPQLSAAPALIQVPQPTTVPPQPVTNTPRRRRHAV